ncbi:hypothetical protein NQ314_004215 [Rhamnusium bicolor]|uniref:Cytochrome P450 n=1 Tax=Rhamnusium bicolor TaxID=1586634 RepID=A0AAV8ZKT0_9CUCU|nr:hypothetical protein NQ314_004215 [Rhamnusium bicolor]
MAQYIYNQCPGARYSGVYQFVQPILLVKDPELIKQLYIKDFDHFVDHMEFIPADADPLWNKGLLSLKGNSPFLGQEWRDMRILLTPSYTSSKIKSMFVLMTECAENFLEHFLKKNEDIITLEVKDVFTRFTNDVIATTAFGVKVDSMAEPNNTLYLMAKEATNFSGFWKTFKILLYLIFPQFSYFLQVNIYNSEVSRFFRELINDTIKTREERGIIRHDMLNLFMEARKGTDKHEDNGIIDTEFATAQGSDLETQRKWPNFPVADRVCTKPYVIQATSPDETPVQLEKGTVLWIPTFALHRDPKFYPNPEHFDPERFSDENKVNIKPYTYLPFGGGPRNCIGSRFALLETKVVFFYILQHFEFVPVEKTQIPLEMCKKNFSMTAADGFWLGLKRIKK